MPATYCYHKDILSNGLRVVTVEMPHLHSASLALYAKAGSRYEDRSDNGLSHFLEHMFFRGTANYPTSDLLNEAIEERGGTLQATTSRDHTCFYVRVHPSHVEGSVDLLGEMFSTPRFDNIDVERGIVMEEIHDDYDEDGKNICVDDIAREQMWPDNPLSYKIVGTRENILGFSVEDLHRHRDRFYRTSNLVFCATGAVTRDAVLAAAERHFSGLPAGPEVEPEVPQSRQASPRLKLVDKDEAQTELFVSFQAFGELHPDYAVLQVIRRLLDDGISSRLQRQICEQLGLAYDIGAGTECYADTGAFDIDVKIEKSKTERVLKEILREVRILRDDSLPARELEKVKRRFGWDLEFSLDGLSDMSGWFGATELFYTPESIADFQARVAAVTEEDVHRVAGDVFRPSNLVVAGLGPFNAGLRRRVRKAVEAFE